MTRLTVERIVPCAPDRLFDLAADVERYPEFLSSWVAARTRRRRADGYETDQVVSFGPARARFATSTSLERPDRIEVTSKDRRFRRFHLRWTFDPAPGGACRIRLDAEVTFRSAVLEQLFGRAVAQNLAGIVSAFEKRAREQSGAPT